MVSKKIKDLSAADLEYLEKVLHQEFKRECERSDLFRSRNKYASDNHCKQLSRLLSAVRSQMHMSKLEKW